MDYFAVIDTETNWNNEVMSIGAVIAEKDTFKKVDDLYFIFDPEYKIGGMFSMVLPVKGGEHKDILFTRKIAMEKFKEAFEKYSVKDLFAYNASFDKNLLSELASYRLSLIHISRSGSCLYRARAVCLLTPIIPRLSCVCWLICRMTRTSSRHTDRRRTSTRSRRRRYSMCRLRK